MKTFAVLLAIPLILVLPTYLQISFESHTQIPPQDQIDAMTNTIESFMKLLSTVWIALGVVTSYLLSRFTYGRKTLVRVSFGEFFMLSLIPVVAIRISFFFKEPSSILDTFFKVFGEGSPLFLLITIFAFCTFVYLVTTRTYQHKMNQE